jgi:proteasome-associated ATPase
MIQSAVELIYSEVEENQFLEVTYANGDKEVSTSRTSTPGR